MTDLLPTRLQGKGVAGTRRAKSGNRRKDDCCRFEEADLCACQGAQGCTEQVIPGAESPALSGGASSISAGSTGTR